MSQDASVSQTIREMSGPELVRFYNQLAGEYDQPAVVRFATRNAGVARIERLQASIAENEAREICQNLMEEAARRAIVDLENNRPTLVEAKVQIAAQRAKVADVTDISMSEMRGDDLRQPAEPVARLTLRGLTEAYNALVPVAHALGVRAKHHTSLFESLALGKRVLQKLDNAIEAARVAQTGGDRDQS